MIAKNLINYMIPPLKPSETVDKALAWMRELHLNELPVVDDGNFYGFFSEKLLLDSKEDKSIISDFDLKENSLHADAEEHYYELLKQAHQNSSNLVAVLDENKKYLGVVSVPDVVTAFSKMSSINSPGAIIVLSMPAINYSMAEISRIIETESGKILSCFIETHPEDNAQIKLTIKLSNENVVNITSALERFGYHIVSKFGTSEVADMDQERLDTLMKYLQI